MTKNSAVACCFLKPIRLTETATYIFKENTLILRFLEKGVEVEVINSATSTSSFFFNLQLLSSVPYQVNSPQINNCPFYNKYFIKEKFNILGKNDIDLPTNTQT